MEIRRFTQTCIDDVIDFELRLRQEENFWGWEIDDKYIADVTRSFEDEKYAHSVSLLAYKEGKVLGRIDSTLICSHFDGSVKAYLDWICVLKSARHRGVAQALLSALRERLRMRGIDTLVALIASNEEAQRFYRNIEGAQIRDEGFWLTP